MLRHYLDYDCDRVFRLILQVCSKAEAVVRTCRDEDSRDSCREVGAYLGTLEGIPLVEASCLVSYLDPFRNKDDFFCFFIAWGQLGKAFMYEKDPYF